MSWDGLPGMESDANPRLSLANALRAEFPGIVELDASVAKGRAYLAVRTIDGQVRPCYLWLERDEDLGGVMYKDQPIDESPSRWPLKVAEALTTWEP